MRRKIIIGAVIVVVLGLLGFGISTGVLTGKVLPALGKIAKAVPPKMWISLGFKFLILTGLMGWVTKLVNAHKERFINGENDYRLSRDYSLVVGYDFQTKPLLKRLLMDTRDTTWSWRALHYLCKIPLLGYLLPTPGRKVLLITNRDVRFLRSEMATELTKMERERLLYMRRELAISSAYAGLRIRGARAIYLMGDEGMPGRDGIVLQAADAITTQLEDEIAAASEDSQKEFMSIRAYLQFEDPGFYAQMRTRGLSMDRKDPKSGKPLFDLEVFNFYDSWVWKCWSVKDSNDGSDPYLPIRFIPNAERVELFVVGSGRAAKAVVDSAITLMNYGSDTRRCRLSVVSNCETEILPPSEVIEALPELEIVSYPMRDLNRVVMPQMITAASNAHTVVTVVIVEDAPEKTTKTYLGLPFALHNLDVSVLLWMGTQTRNLPKKDQLKIIDKDGNVCDKIKLRYFGMFDCPPWLDGDRYAGVIDINYYWSICDLPELPRVVDEDGHFPAIGDGGFVAAALKLWDEDKANNKWLDTERWAKWSNTNSAGSCKEKAALINGRKLDATLLRRLLTAEHNRWWSERLLADWRYSANRDNERRLHPDLVPFEKLRSHKTQDYDKINVAVMARLGYIG